MAVGLDRCVARSRAKPADYCYRRAGVALGFKTSYPLAIDNGTGRNVTIGPAVWSSPYWSLRCSLNPLHSSLGYMSPVEYEEQFALTGRGSCLTRCPLQGEILLAKSMERQWDPLNLM